MRLSNYAVLCASIVSMSAKDVSAEILFAQVPFPALLTYPDNFFLAEAGVTQAGYGFLNTGTTTEIVDWTMFSSPFILSPDAIIAPLDVSIRLEPGEFRELRILKASRNTVSFNQNEGLAEILQWTAQSTNHLVAGFPGSVAKGFRVIPIQTSYDRRGNPDSLVVEFHVENFTDAANTSRTLNFNQSGSFLPLPPVDVTLAVGESTTLFVTITPNPGSELAPPNFASFSVSYADLLGVELDRCGVLVLLGAEHTNPSDINGDGVVDTADLGILLGAFGTTSP